MSGLEDDVHRSSADGLKTQHRGLLICAVICYLVSLGLPIHNSGGPEGDQFPGILALVLGATGGFMGLVPAWSGYCWFANFAWLLSLLPGRSVTWYRLASILAVSLCLLYFGMREIPTNEAGGVVASVPASGYYLWLTAMVLRVGAAFGGKAPA